MHLDNKYSQTPSPGTLSPYLPLSKAMIESLFLFFENGAQCAPKVGPDSRYIDQTGLRFPEVCLLLAPPQSSDQQHVPPQLASISLLNNTQF